MKKIVTVETSQIAELKKWAKEMFGFNMMRYPAISSFKIEEEQVKAFKAAVKKEFPEACIYVEDAE